MKPASLLPENMLSLQGFVGNAVLSALRPADSDGARAGTGRGLYLFRARALPTTLSSYRWRAAFPPNPRKVETYTR